MDTQVTAAKETAAQRVERVKREKAPWSMLEDIRRYAREGIASIPEEDLNVRFKHWGIYTQGDGGGVRGDAVPYFMMRLRTPNGVMTAPQVRTVAELSERYAQSSLDITNRQNFQLHWLRIEDIPTVWDELAKVGWGSMGSCGDNTRTVTGCPLAGVEHDELIDASPIATAIDAYFNGNPEYQNLPRKFKISVTGCAHWCTYPEINDIGLTAARRGGEVGFHVRVGGGLSTRPHLAVRLDAFVRQAQVLDVMRAIVGIFRDSDELRLNRAKARMKFLFLNHGWDAARFLAEVQHRLGYALDAAGEEALPEDTYRDHVGVHPQKQSGLFYAGFSVPAGRLSPAQLRRIAELAEEFGSGALRATAMQNLVVLDIPERSVAAFAAAAESVGIPLAASPFQRGIVSCTGSQYCKLAITETKGFSAGLHEEMERRFPGFRHHVKVHVTGCPNSCGQHWIADIGLQGVAVKVEGESVDGYDVFVGGGLGARAGFARRLGVRPPAARVPDALERLFRLFLATRGEGERFQHWVSRTDDAVLRAELEDAPAVSPVSVMDPVWHNAR